MPDSSAIRAGKAYIELGLDPSRLTAGLKDASARLQKMGSIIRNIGVGMAAMGAALTAPLIAMAGSAADAGTALKLASEKTGASVESLSALKYAAEQTKVEFDQLTNGVGKMQKFIAEAFNGSAQATEQLNRLGISIQSLAGKSADQQMGVIADGLEAIGDPAQRAAASMAIFGKAGRELLPMLIGGSKSLQEYTDRAKALGIVMGDDEATAAFNYGRAMKDIAEVMERLKTVIGGAIIPTLKDQAEKLLAVGVAAIKFVKEHKEIIATILKVGTALTIAGTAIIGIGAMFSGMSSIVGGVGMVLGALGGTFAIVTAAAFSGIGLVIGGLVGLGAYFLATSKYGGIMADGIKDAFANIMSNLDVMLGSWQGFTGVMGHVWNEAVFAMRAAWIGLKGYLSEVWEGMKSSFPNVVYGWGSAVAAFAATTWTTMKDLGANIAAMWDNVVQHISDAMAGVKIRHQVEGDTLNEFDGKTMDKKSANKLAVEQTAPQIVQIKAQVEAELSKSGLTGGALADKRESMENERLAPVQAQQKQIAAGYEGRKLSDADIQGIIDSRVNTELAQRDAMSAQVAKARETALDARLKANQAAFESELAGIQKWAGDGLKKTPLDHDRDAHNAEAATEAERAKLAADRAQEAYEHAKLLADAPKLSGRLNDLKNSIQIPGLPEAPKQAGTDHAIENITSRGSFNPFALGGGVSGGDPAKRTAKATEQMVKLLGGIHKNIDDGGGTFY